MSVRTDHAEKKEDLQNLVAKGCPLGDDFYNSNCPVSNVRKLTAKNLAHYLNNLSEEQIDSIFEYHEDCHSMFSSYVE